MGALQRCADSISSDKRVSQLRVSPVYETPPWGNVKGGEFLNAAVSGCWSGSDTELLEFCRSLEAREGSPVRKLGLERPLDVDILFLQGGVSRPELELPHSRMSLRKFVLVPLSDVWEEEIPGLGKTPAELLSHVNDSSSIIFKGTLNGY
ncbi:2-amino-4-hydroxy-6-hydroxymethyldihydropteridine diphosphokinase [Candidatus Fermentibacteria bacterium]|nr:MAG: 2-amino-4-hydroxy-6-hydroxymethyldihydropteridine diphosphokinase [Candidatus Fermentibacteria bacterium]